MLSGFFRRSHALAVNAFSSLRRYLLDESIAHLLEQTFWQRAVNDISWISSCCFRSNIRSRPNELIGLCQNYPRLLFIKTKTAPGFDWNLQCVIKIMRRGMSYRNDENSYFVISDTDCQNDGARPILYAFVLPFEIIITPQICISDDKARNRSWKGHARYFAS